MTNLSLPGQTAAVIDRGFLLTLPWRTWANRITNAVLELERAGGTGTIPVDPVSFTITGSGWIQVTGSVASGNFNVTQRQGLTTDNLPEGSDNLYYTDDRADARIAAWAAAPSVGPLTDAVDDAAAAVALVPVGSLYRTGSVVKIRVA